MDLLRNIIGIQVGDRVLFNRPGHRCHGRVFIVEKLYPPDHARDEWEARMTAEDPNLPYHLDPPSQLAQLSCLDRL